MSKRKYNLLNNNERIEILEQAILNLKEGKNINNKIQCYDNKNDIWRSIRRDMLYLDFNGAVYRVGDGDSIEVPNGRALMPIPLTAYEMKHIHNKNKNQLVYVPYFSNVGYRAITIANAIEDCVTLCYNNSDDATHAGWALYDVDK